MNLLIDTNVLVDVLQKREPHFHYSSLIWKMCETGKAKGFVSSLSIANIIYVLKKHIPKEKIEYLLKKLSIIFRIVPLTYDELFKASELHWNNFENAVQFVTAQTNDASFIITRNKKDYTDTGKLKAITPEEFFWLLKSFDIRRYLHDEASAEP